MNKKVMLKWAVLMFWVGYIAQTGIAMPVESPLPLCDVSGKLGIGANCTFLTPVLNCTGVETYDVVNLSGIEVVNDASLTKLNELFIFSILLIPMNLTILLFGFVMAQVEKFKSYRKVKS